jgi:hypothetical protein
MLPLNLYARVRFCFVHLARETAGAARTRSSLRPLFSMRANEDTKLGRNAPRDREAVSAHSGLFDTTVAVRSARTAPSSLLANGSRECAPDDRLREAIHTAEEMDCFVANASLRKRFAFVAGNDGVTFEAAASR